MSYICNLQGLVDESLPFNVKNIPKNYADDIKKFQIGYHPKKFKFRNDTGIFEMAIYLDDHYTVVIDPLIITKKFVIVGESRIVIEKNGTVCFYAEDYTLKKAVKTKTGFILDRDNAKMMREFINDMKSFSKYLKGKYYKDTIR